MAPKLSPEDARALLDNEMISKETYDKMAMPAAEEPIDNSVTYGESTSDVRELFPNVPKNAPIVASSMVPVIGDVINTARDINANNSAVKASGAQEVTAGIGSTPALENIQNLPNVQKQAEVATQQIAPKEEEILGQMSETQKNYNQQILNQQQTLYSQIQNNLKTVQTALEDKDKALNAMSQQISIDPQKAVKDRLVDSPVLSAIAVGLSGIGSGLTGQSNAAIDMIHKTIDRNIAIRAQNIQAEYDRAQGLGQIAEGALNKTQVAAVSQQIAAATTYKAVEGVVLGLANQLQSQTARERATLLIRQLNLGYQDAASKFFEMTKGIGTYNDTRKADAVGQLLANTNPGNASEILNKNTKQVATPQQAPAASPEQSFTVPEASQPKRPSGFLDKMSELFSKSKGKP